MDNCRCIAIDLMKELLKEKDQRIDELIIANNNTLIIKRDIIACRDSEIAELKKKIEHLNEDREPMLLATAEAVKRAQDAEELFEVAKRENERLLKLINERESPARQKQQRIAFNKDRAPSSKTIRELLQVAGPLAIRIRHAIRTSNNFTTALEEINKILQGVGVKEIKYINGDVAFYGVDRGSGNGTPTVLFDTNRKLYLLATVEQARIVGTEMGYKLTS